MRRCLCSAVLLFSAALSPRHGWAQGPPIFYLQTFHLQSFDSRGSHPQSPQSPQQPEPQSSNKPKQEGSSDPGHAAAQTTRQAAEATFARMRDWETQWLVGAYVSRNQPLSPPSLKERQEIYLQQTWLTPGTYMKRMFDAGIDQARGWPRQWDDGWTGYTERWASREGQFIAANSLSALGDAKLGYEPRYNQCRCRGFWPRTRHAIIRDFLTYNRSERELRPQWALYGGAFAGGVIATAWKPKPLNPFVQGGWAMLGQAGYGTLVNFFTEFAIDINRKLGSRK
jgi:hypothetical protein